MPPRRFGEPAREELEATIRTTAGLPDGTRFALEDDDGDSIVLSNSIPNGTKLTLRVLDAKKGELWSKISGENKEIRFKATQGIAGWPAT